jgi:hypothetical protein
MDYDPKWDSKRIEYGFAKGKSCVGPVENVNSPDITCRYAPLKVAGIEAEARAGSTMSFQWLDWFQSHKGPVITVSKMSLSTNCANVPKYMAPVPESGNPADAEFFKVDEATYDPKTMTWGTDWLMKNKNIREVLFQVTSSLVPTSSGTKSYHYTTLSTTITSRRALAPNSTLNASRSRLREKELRLQPVSSSLVDTNGMRGESWLISSTELTSIPL